MFKIVVNGRNIALTDALKTYIQDKFERLDHHFDFVQEVHVFLSVHKNPSIKKGQLAEATVHVKQAVIRVEVSSEDLYGSIDLLVDKVDRCLSKHKTKLLHRSKSSKSSAGSESLRRSAFEEAVAEESTYTYHEQDEELEGVFLTFVDDAEEVVSAYPKV